MKFVLLIFVSAFLSMLILGTEYSLIMPVNILNSSPQPKEDFGVVTDVSYIRQASRILTLLDQNLLTYTVIEPSAVTNESVFDNVDVVWTFTNPSHQVTNATAIKNFAKNHVVISHTYDFSEWYDVTEERIQSGYEVINREEQYNITYKRDFGFFQEGDIVPIYAWGNPNSLSTISSSDLSSFSNVTEIAELDSEHTAILQMEGVDSSVGFFVLDNYCLKTDTRTSNNYHFISIINTVKTCRIGSYGKWNVDGFRFKSFTEYMNQMDDLAIEYASLVTVNNFGTSEEGRTLKALFIGLGTTYIYYISCIHGNEMANVVGTVRFAELLCEWYGTDDFWASKLLHYTFIIIPVLNPDGFVAFTRNNHNNKDLNRQFPPFSVDPLTEAESQALYHLMTGYPPMLLLDFHSGDPNQLLYEEYPSGDYCMPEPRRTFINWTWHQANETFVALGHYGTYAGMSVGKINYIGNGYEGLWSGGSIRKGTLRDCVTFNLSGVGTYWEIIADNHTAIGGAVFCLYAQDVDVSLMISAAKYFDYLKADEIPAYTTGQIEYCMKSGNNYFLYGSGSLFKINCSADRSLEKVYIDGAVATSGVNYTYLNGLVTIVTPVTTSVRLRFTASSLALSGGWNMVSFPCIPMDDASFSNIFNGIGYYQVLTWDGVSYVPLDPSDQAEAGKGYWVLVLEDAIVTIYGMPVESYELDLPTGWSMIGSIYPCTVDANLVFPSTYQLLTWDSTGYVTVTTIEPGKGYWVLLFEPTHIVVAT